MPSFYIDKSAEELGKYLDLEGDEHHHLSMVRRAKTGDQILLNNGRGVLIEAKIIEISKKSSKLEISNIKYVERSIDFAMAFCLLKNHHDELIVEKLTELGVTMLFPLQSDFTIRKYSFASLERFRKIAMAAIKQCDNPYLPVVYEGSGLIAGVNRARSLGYTPVICSEKKPDMWISDLGLDIKTCFFVGPEGGWSNAELSFIDEEKLISVSISHMILRAETAAIAVAAQWAGLVR